MAPSLSEKGDVVCILLGCDFPVLLRKVDGHYTFIGECYAHGIMDGEAMKDLAEGKYKLEKFEIH
jgi:hypothetical protein